MTEFNNLIPTTNRTKNVSTAEIAFTGIHAALQQMGFKPLTSEVAATLVGKHVVFGTEYTDIAGNVTGYKLFDRTIAELLKNGNVKFQRNPVSISELSAENDEAEFDSGYYDDILPVGKFQNHLFLVISDSRINTSEDAKATGFKQLSEVNPSDLPLGTLTLIRHKNLGTINSVIVRVMGKNTDGNQVLLGWRQSPIVAGQWDTFRMVNTEENQFKLYEVLVLSK